METVVIGAHDIFANLEALEKDVHETIHALYEENDSRLKGIYPEILEELVISWLWEGDPVKLLTHCDSGYRIETVINTYKAAKEIVDDYYREWNEAE